MGDPGFLWQPARCLGRAVGANHQLIIGAACAAVLPVKVTAILLGGLIVWAAVAGWLSEQTAALDHDPYDDGRRP